MDGEAHPRWSGWVQVTLVLVLRHAGQGRVGVGRGDGTPTPRQDWSANVYPLL